jgi:hypothetical protein
MNAFAVNQLDAFGLVIECMKSFNSTYFNDTTTALRSTWTLAIRTVRVFLSMSRNGITGLNLQWRESKQEKKTANISIPGLSTVLSFLRSEFRLLLVYLRNYFECWQMFDCIDSGDDRRIHMDEFKSAIPMMETWGVKTARRCRKDHSSH